MLQALLLVLFMAAREHETRAFRVGGTVQPNHFQFTYQYTPYIEPKCLV